MHTGSAKEGKRPSVGTIPPKKKKIKIWQWLFSHFHHSHSAWSDIFHCRNRWQDMDSLAQHNPQSLRTSGYLLCLQPPLYLSDKRQTFSPRKTKIKREDYYIFYSILSINWRITLIFPFYSCQTHYKVSLIVIDLNFPIGHTEQKNLTVRRPSYMSKLISL